ncbi:exosortase A [Desulfosarcina ovata]|uniref:Exosortase n=1 Tax=Desulfosarcina ovata subsp. ovata TaxID=2752305 RepID=A0A5K8A7D7_9BACT|nr:exosortase A [Desulfosarcina ovata]BBO88543.1 exosortase [Desulfosarcina ovata subsp. ovata]
MIRFIFLLVLWLLAFYPVYPEMVSTWLNHSDNSHGILVPFVSLYFIWNHREAIIDLHKRESIWGLLLLIFSLVLYLISYAGGVAVAARAMIVFSLIGLVLYNWGGDVTRKLLFPMLFLLFMVPIPVSLIGLISLPLQHVATDIAAFVIRLTSIPVHQEGNMLYFVQTQLEVAEACSGLRSIVSLLMLGSIFIYLSHFSPTAKIIFLLSTIPLAMFANIVRVTGTGILAHFYGSAVARGFLHDFSGMVVFVFGLALLYVEYKLINIWQKRET